MVKQSAIFDMSDELLIQRHNKGIRLVKPIENQRSDYINGLSLDIATLFKLPLNIFFVNNESIALKVNETTTRVCGVMSPKDCIGKTMHAVAKKEAAEFCLRHDQNVIKMNKLIISEVPLVLLNETTNQIISFKFPWYNADDKVIGVFGCSFKIGCSNSPSLSEALTLISNMGILPSNNLSNIDSYMPGTKLGDVYLSKRESECLHHMVRGKSIKAIANKLGLSAKTVENYINRIKFKLGVSYKSELIEIAIDYLL